MKLKKMKTHTLLFVAIILGIVQGKAQEKTLLYKIEGNDIRTSYVFGTMHMMPKEEFLIEDKVQLAFDNSEQLVLEADIGSPTSTEEYMTIAKIEENDSLQNHMTVEEFNILDEYFIEKMGVGMVNFNKMKPFVVSSTAMIAHLGQNLASHERTFSAMAKEQEKEVNGFETITFQMNLFNGVSYEEQIDDIIDMLKEEGDIDGYFDKLINAYKTKDIEHLHNILNEYFEDDIELKEKILFKRNEDWIGKVGNLSKNKTTFYAVGAGHLGSKRGVINLLKESGYEVTPIPY